MRSWIKKALLLACVAAPTAAAEAQDPAWVPQAAVVDNAAIAPSIAANGFTLTPEGERFSLRGWLDGGYVYNAGNPSSHYNGPYNSVYRSNEGMGNQAYGIVEWLLPQDNSFGFGARVDGIYGMDFLVAQSVGFETNQDGSRKWNSSQFYGVAIPQAYVQAGCNDTNVKVGHFYSIVGYEGVQAANNFFYSKSYSYQFGGPFTHWGALASHQLTENLQIQGGVHMGWNALDSVEDHASFIGGLKYTESQKRWWTSLAVTTGQEFNNVAGLPGIVPAYDNRTRYSFILDLHLTDNLEYVVHQWLGLQVDGVPNNGSAALWYGVDQYIYYRINDCWKIGGRAEWFRDQDGTRVGLTLPNNPNVAPLPGSYYSGTVGLNYTPCHNLVIRPEARWDFVADTQGGRLPYGDGNNNNQFMLALDVILKF